MSYLARVRGIYATAITKLLLDHGFGITQASDKILKRFSLEPRYDPPHVTVKDNDEKTGLVIIGQEDAVKKVLEVLSGEIDDLIVEWYEPQIHSTYLGVVLEAHDDKYVIDLGNNLRGVLHSRVRYNVGDEVLVSVRRPAPPGEYAELTDNITISGRYLRLIRGGIITFSRFIKDDRKKEELLSIALSFNIEGWGVRWRSSAAYASSEELCKELSELLELGNRLIKEKPSGGPKLVREGERVVEVLLPKTAKLKLDEARSRVVPTVTGHHILKNLGEPYTTLVDFCEELLAMGVSKEQIEKAMSVVISDKGPHVGSTVAIKHVQIYGRVIELGRGKIIERTDEYLAIRREIYGTGIYDGLGVPKERGDYCITHVYPDKWYLVHHYFSRNGELKGVYVNINTPPEVSPSEITYIDLEVDVVTTPNTEPRVIDEEKLHHYHSIGAIPQKLLLKIEQVIQEAKKVAQEHVEMFSKK
ncbi:MAG: hypothetical protein DRJ40_09980 [Thermoprotei archaeon]|nr:MAG: hypothetical protein DRJ40_09980 [Thermoprotei archaeon]